MVSAIQPSEAEINLSQGGNEPSRDSDGDAKDPSRIPAGKAAWEVTSLRASPKTSAPRRGLINLPFPQKAMDNLSQFGGHVIFAVRFRSGLVALHVAGPHMPIAPSFLTWQFRARMQPALLQASLPAARAVHALLKSRVRLDVTI